MNGWAHTGLGLALVLPGQFVGFYGVRIPELCYHRWLMSRLREKQRLLHQWRTGETPEDSKTVETLSTQVKMLNEHIRKLSRLEPPSSNVTVTKHERVTPHLKYGMHAPHPDWIKGDLLLSRQIHEIDQKIDDVHEQLRHNLRMRSKHLHAAHGYDVMAHQLLSGLCRQRQKLVDQQADGRRSHAWRSPVGTTTQSDLDEYAKTIDGCTREITAAAQVPGSMLGLQRR